MEKELPRKEMVEEAFRLAASAKESDKSLAMLFLKKAIASKENEHPYYNDLLKIYTYFLEADLGVASEKDNLAGYLLDSVRCLDDQNRTSSLFGSVANLIDHHGALKMIFKYPPLFNSRIANLINKDLGQAWVKSLRFDALVTQLKTWEEEDKIDSVRMKRIREIVGE